MKVRRLIMVSESTRGTPPNPAAGASNRSNDVERSREAGECAVSIDGGLNGSNLRTSQLPKGLYVHDDGSRVHRPAPAAGPLAVDDEQLAKPVALGDARTRHAGQQQAVAICDSELIVAGQQKYRGRYRRNRGAAPREGVPQSIDRLVHEAVAEHRGPRGGIARGQARPPREILEGRRAMAREVAPH